MADESKKLPDRLKARPKASFSSSKPPAGKAALDPEPMDFEWENLVAALRRNRRSLLRLPGVTAVDVGYRIENGSFVNELALRVHVERKRDDKYFEDHPHEYLSPKKGRDRPGGLKERKFFGLSDESPVLVDILEAGYRPAIHAAALPRPNTVLETPLESQDINRSRRIDPLVGGISIGSPNAPVGTLGALVWDRLDGSVCILSNWHVLAGYLQAQPGNPCLQPGQFDRGRASDMVARLKRWSFDSQTDAAIAELTGNRHYCAGEILGLSRQISGETDPYLGMKVLKSGRSTSCTSGFVDGLYFSSAIRYGNGVTQIFEDQIHIAPLDPEDRISEPGDSGAVWVTDANGDGYQAVGLHFGGDQLRSAFGEYALANPIKLVIERLGFSFRPVFLEIRDEDVISMPVTSRPETGNGADSISLISGGFTGAGIQEGDPIEIPPKP